MTTNNRRTFLQQAALLTGAFSATSLFNQAHAETFALANKKIAHLTPQQAAMDEDYWATIQRAYSANGNIMILNNGGVSPSPIVVQDAVERYNRLSNQGPSYYM
jgi:3-dehydroquinate dehydratase